VIFNFIKIGSVNRESVRLFSSSSINFSIGVFPVVERVIDVGGNFVLGGFLVLEHHVSSSHNGSDCE